MYLWPKTLDITVMDPSTYVLIFFVSMLLNLCLGCVLLCANIIDFHRALRKPVGILDVKIVKAMRLKKKDLLGSSDPYVKLKLTENNLPSKTTTVKHKNLNPEWNEEFSLVVKDPNSQVIEFQVYDWEQVSHFDVLR